MQTAPPHIDEAIVASICLISFTVVLLDVLFYLE